MYCCWRYRHDRWICWMLWCHQGKRMYADYRKYIHEKIMTVLTLVKSHPILIFWRYSFEIWGGTVLNLGWYWNFSIGPSHVFALVYLVLIQLKCLLLLWSFHHTKERDFVLLFLFLVLFPEGMFNHTKFSYIINATRKGAIFLKGAYIANKFWVSCIKYFGVKEFFFLTK